MVWRNGIASNRANKGSLRSNDSASIMSADQVGLSMMKPSDPILHGSFWIRHGKRATDLVAGLLLLLLCSPLLVLASLAIRVSSPGPIFFRQTRGGRDGQPFTVVNFRTMRAGRIPDPKELVPLDHVEITPLGRLLRRIKIDELPQLWNV